MSEIEDKQNLIRGLEDKSVRYLDLFKQTRADITREEKKLADITRNVYQLRLHLFNVR